MNMRFAVFSAVTRDPTLSHVSRSLSQNNALCTLQEWHQKCSHYFILTACRGSAVAPALLAQHPGFYYSL